ncbi:MAG: TonB-dependent receptor [Acidobacteria bacterium]|nr:TonB-dependent receptor [Acidobacteriota bacterium]
MWLLRTVLLAALVGFGSPDSLFCTRAVVAVEPPSGQIVVRVRDASGAELPHVTVTLTNIASGVSSTELSDSAGRCVFDGLSVGIYRLRIRKETFSEAARNIEIALPDEHQDISFELNPGMITEQVTVTATRGERDVLEVPGRTESLNETILTRINPATTADALANVPNLEPVNSGPYLTRPRLRGLDSTRLLILIDGERLNNSRTSTGAAGVEIGLIDPSQVDTIEVVHGMGSALYGTDALAGTINITTQLPERTDDGLRFGGSLSTYYSSNESGRRGTGRVDVAGRWFASRVSLMLERFPNYHSGQPFNESSIPMIEAGIIKHQFFGPISDNFNEPFTRPTSEIGNSASHGSNVNVTQRLFFGDRHWLRAGWQRRRVADTGFPDFLPPYFFQVINLPLSRLDKASLYYEASALNSWFTRFKVSGYWQHQERILFNDFFVLGLSEPRLGDPPVASLTRVDIQSTGGQDVKSFGYDVQVNFLISSKNILTVGTSLFRDHSKDSRYVVTDVTTIGKIGRPPLPPTFFPFHEVIVKDNVSTAPRVPISNFQNTAVFFQDEHEVNRWLRLIGSLRIDRFDLGSVDTPGYIPQVPDVADANPPIDPSTVPPSTAISFSRTAVTGDFGLVVRPAPYLSLTARVGRSFRQPNLGEIFFSGSAESGTLILNIKVGPEKGINVDIGAKLRTSRGSASVTYFNNTYHDFLSRQIVSFSRLNGGALYQTLNFSKVRIQGVESDFEIPFQAGNMFFAVYGNASYLYGQILSGTNPITKASIANTPAFNISPFKGVAGLRWQDNRDRFWWDYSLRAQTHVNRVSALLFTSPLLEPEDLWNLNGFSIHTMRGGLKLAGGEHTSVSLTVGLENLGNKFYREQFQFAPARGRSVTIGLNLKYF